MHYRLTHLPTGRTQLLKPMPGESVLMTLAGACLSGPEPHYPTHTQRVALAAALDLGLDFADQGDWRLLKVTVN